MQLNGGGGGLKQRLSTDNEFYGLDTKIIFSKHDYISRNENFSHVGGLLDHFPLEREPVP